MARKARPAVTEALESARRELASAKPGTHVGDLLWWDFQSGFTMASSDVRTFWLAHGLNPDADFPSPPDHGTAFTRAVERAKRAAGSKDCRVEDCAATSDGSRRVAIVQLKRNGTVSGESVGVVVLESGGVVRVETEDKHGLALLVQSSMAHFKDRYTTDDVRFAVIAILDRWLATPCRQAPPHIVYWLPSPGSEVIRRVRDAIVDMGAGKLHLSPMDRGNDSMEAASSAANDGLETRLREFSEQVEAWKLSPPGRTSTIERRVVEADELRATAGLYRSILGTAVADIDAKVDAIQNGLREAMGLVS